jgi:hypothetical protein
MQKLPKMKRPRRPVPMPTTHKRSTIKATPPPKKSSNVASTSYDPDLGHLTVQFASGSRYRYEGVSKDTASGLDTADSVGRYLHAHVIGKHDAVKI